MLSFLFSPPQLPMVINEAPITSKSTLLPIVPNQGRRVWSLREQCIAVLVEMPPVVSSPLVSIFYFTAFNHLSSYILVQSYRCLLILLEIQFVCLFLVTLLFGVVSERRRQCHLQSHLKTLSSLNEFGIKNNNKKNNFVLYLKLNILE